MPDTTSQLLVQIIHQLDAIIAWQRRISEQLENLPFPQLENGQSQMMSAVDRFTKLLIAQGLPSSPARTREFTINAITPTPIYSNDSTIFQRIDVTNDDPAQPCWLGDRNVSPITGQVLLAQNTRAFTIPRGAELYAICVVATLSVRVAEGYDLVAIGESIQQ